MANPSTSSSLGAFISPFPPLGPKPQEGVRLGSPLIASRSLSPFLPVLVCFLGVCASVCVCARDNSGGLAGLALAARLSENANMTVAVIEAGGSGDDVADKVSRSSIFLPASPELVERGRWAASERLDRAGGGELGSA